MIIGGEKRFDLYRFNFWFSVFCIYLWNIWFHRGSNYNFSVFYICYINANYISCGGFSMVKYITLMITYIFVFFTSIMWFTRRKSSNLLQTRLNSLKETQAAQVEADLIKSRADALIKLKESGVLREDFNLNK